MSYIYPAPGVADVQVVLNLKKAQQQTWPFQHFRT
jgi:hypothetical protein